MDAPAALLSLQTSSPSCDVAGLELGCYRVAVRAVDDEGFNGMESSQELCLIPTPPPVPLEAEPERWWQPLVFISLAIILVAL